MLRSLHVDTKIYVKLVSSEVFVGTYLDSWDGLLWLKDVSFVNGTWSDVNVLASLQTSQVRNGAWSIPIPHMIVPLGNVRYIQPVLSKT